MEHVGSDPGTVHGTLHDPATAGSMVGSAARIDPAPTSSGKSTSMVSIGTRTTSSGCLTDDPYFRLTPSEVPDSVWPFNQPSTFCSISRSAGPGQATTHRRSTFRPRCSSTGSASRPTNPRLSPCVLADPVQVRCVGCDPEAEPSAFSFTIDA